MARLRKRWLTAAAGALMLCAGTLAYAGSTTSKGYEQPAPADSTITFFYYDDIAAVAPFYGEVMGLEKTLDMEWVNIFRITANSSVGLTEKGHGYHDPAEDKPAMLSIVTGDVDAWYERLTGAGAKVVKALPPQDAMPAAEEAPIRGFIVEDPGGYTIEVFAWREAEDAAQ